MTSKEKLLVLAVAGECWRHWYRNANTAIHQFSFAYDIDPERFIKVLAVLSPQVSVAQNLHLAVGWCCFGVEPKVVWSVATSLDRLVKSGYQRSAIRGPKTGRFADALMGDPNAVVLDTHMGYALGVDANKLRNKGVQLEAEKRVGWVARLLEWSPSEVQAAIWCAQRKRAGYNYTSIERYMLDRAYNRHKNNNPF